MNLGGLSVGWPDPPFLSKIRQLFIIIMSMNYKIYVKIRLKIGVRAGRLSSFYDNSILAIKIGIKITILHFI